MENIILYNTEDGKASVKLYAKNNTVWLSQAQMGELFSISKSSISEHILHIFDEGEINPEAVVRKFRTTAADGKQYLVTYYNLDVILAVGFPAELIIARADATKPNMALTAWQGARVRKSDIFIAKNYLTNDEIDSLNRLVSIFLESAELSVKLHKTLTLDYWRNTADKILLDHDVPLLHGRGRYSNVAMKEIVFKEYDAFEKRRKEYEAIQADEQDLQELEEDVKSLQEKKE